MANKFKGFGGTKKGKPYGPGTHGIPLGQHGPGQEFSEDDVEAFMNRGFILYCSSSNVSWMQYDREGRELTVKFHTTPIPYVYDNVNPTEALYFVRAVSKGSAVWDILRVRGSKTAHRKNYHALGW